MVCFIKNKPLGGVLGSCCCILTLVKWSDMFITTSGCSETLTLLGVVVSTEKSDMLSSIFTHSLEKIMNAYERWVCALSVCAK